MARQAPIPISIVVPLFNEVHGLEAFHADLSKNIAELADYSFEIIHREDGSQGTDYEA